MLTNTKNIKTRPEVQLVMHMDGWEHGHARSLPTKPLSSVSQLSLPDSNYFIRMNFREPGSSIMTPEELLKLKPQPVYIQYQ
jgi:hypothetical protein